MTGYVLGFIVFVALVYGVYVTGKKEKESSGSGTSGSSKGTGNDRLK